MILTFIPTAFAASDNAIAAANALYTSGLFKGTGTNADGTPNFDLDRAPTRNEAVTMLVRLLGKETEATGGEWEIPFTDVADWAKPYVGYAYANGLTTGMSATTFGGEAVISASQYITFVLRALDYENGTDFQWDMAWELSDSLGITDGSYNADTSSFTRGDVATISYDALFIPKKDSTVTIADELGQESDEETVSGIADCFDGKYWIGINGNDEAHFCEMYYFEGNTYGCAYQCLDGSDRLLFEGYDAGSFTVSDTTLSLHRTESYAIAADSSEIQTDQAETDLHYEVTMLSESEIILNNWKFVCLIDNAETYGLLQEQYEEIKDEVCTKRSKDPAVTDYTYLAQSDFRGVQRDYSTAVAQCAYVYAFTNANGEQCVLTDVRYKIINNHSIFTLHNLTTGAVITNPDSYYQKQANRAFGASKIAYMKLANEIIGYHTKMLQAMKAVLESGQNTWSGIYVDATTLSQ